MSEPSYQGLAASSSFKTPGKAAKVGKRLDNKAGEAGAAKHGMDDTKEMAKISRRFSARAAKPPVSAWQANVMSGIIRRRTKGLI
jgi:hypothetical protein